MQCGESEQSCSLLAANAILVSTHDVAAPSFEPVQRAIKAIDDGQCSSFLLSIRVLMARSNRTFRCFPRHGLPDSRHNIFRHLSVFS